MSQSQESFRKLPSEEALQLLQLHASRTQESLNTPTSGANHHQHQHKSRPETANFNKAFAASLEEINDEEKQIKQMEEELELAKQRLYMKVHR